MLRKLVRLSLVLSFLMAGAGQSFAAKNFNIMNSTSSFLFVNGTTSNVGIGTTTPQGGFVVNNGNVGIATWAPLGAFQVNSNTNPFIVTAKSNVGLGTSTPQGSLVVTNGNVGVGTWAPLGILQVNGNLNPFIVTSVGNIGLGTSTPQGSLVVTNGNVGIGTWAPLGILQVNGNLNPFIVTSAGNIGLGTSTPQGSLVVTNGNVGIGTWAPSGGLVVMNGNVGVGSAFPGVVLDVQGSARMTGFTLTGNGAGAGNLLVSNGIGIGTWLVAANALGGGGSITSATIYDVAYYSAATTLNGSTAFTFNGTNVGIATAVPGAMFQINTPTTNPFVVTNAGNVGVGTMTPQGALTVINGNVGIGTWVPNAGLIVMSGNVGIGSAFPGVALDVQGSARMTGFTLTGNNAASGNIMVSNGIGIGTWMSSASLLAAGTITNAAAYDVGYYSAVNTINGSTAFTFNGTNVGIATALPAAMFQINTPTTNPFVVTSAGNVGVGTMTPQGALTVINGNVGIGTWLPAYTLDLVNNMTRERFVRRMVTVTAGATPAVNSDTTDVAVISGLSTAITSMTANLTGTPKDGDLLEFRITDTGSPQSITWGASFTQVSVSLPTATVASVMLRVLFEYNGTSGKWECIGTA